MPAAGGQAAQAAEPRGPAKPISPFCELEFGTSHEEFAHRIGITEEEIEVINQGTNECYGWENIKL